MADDSPRKRAPTIIDVAEAAGVSVGTVSRFLNGIPVRDGKRAVIEAAIAALRYNRNAAASAMRTDRSNLVALLVPGYGEFFGNIITSLNTRLAQHGQVLLTHQHDRDYRALRLALQFFKDHRVNAVITPGVPDLRREIDDLVASGIPVLFFNNDIDGLPVDRVFSRNTEAAEHAMRYLVDMGHRHIGFLSGDDTETSATERLAGYRRAVARYNLPVDDRYIAGGAWRRHTAFYGTRQLLDLPTPPTAILAASNDLALGVMDYAREYGINLGSDLSLVSFDDSELFRQARPGITSIAQPTAEIGTEIAELVMSHVTGTHGGHSREIRLDCTLQLRDSVARIG